jgi:preprotein translocase subunit SecA
MSGTLQDTADELQKTYGVLVEVIPPHRPNRRHLLPNRYFVNWAAKVEAIVVDVALRQRRGQPILIGTNSIQKSEWLAEALRSQGLSFVVLNGLQDKSEAEIVAQAGSPGQVTIATNMAGRGTDIALHPDVRGLGGLHVIGTEPNQCRRVDRQLIGRAARQGDPGSAQFFVSADDDLLNQQETGLARRICRTAGKRGEAIGNFATAVWQLQQKAERTQLRIRQQLVGNDVWLNQARQSVFGT